MFEELLATVHYNKKEFFYSAAENFWMESTEYFGSD